MAKTYYVATNGNDSWAGTEQNPFRTIQRGASAVAAGDTLLVKAGTYVEQVSVSASGTSGNPVTIKAFGNDKVIIDGRAGVDGLNSGLPDGTVVRTGPLTGKGFKYTNLVNLTGDYIVWDGIDVTRSMGTAIAIYKPNNRRPQNTTVRNCTLYRNRHHALEILLADNCEINNVRMDQNVQWVENDIDSVHGANLNGKFVKHIKILDCTISHAWGEAIMIDANDYDSQWIEVRRCTLYDNLWGNLNMAGVSDIILDRNFLYSSVDAFNPSLAYEWIPRGLNLRAREAELGVDKTHPGIERATVTNNIFVGNTVNFVFGGGKKELPGGGFVDDPDRYLKDIVFANNTILNGLDAMMQDTNPNQINIIFKNNIIVQENNKFFTSKKQVTNWKMSNNLFWPTRPPELAGSNDVIADPKLVDLSAILLHGKVNPDRYKITANSPAINKGIVIDGIIEDYFGGKRVGNPDIGAHEFGADATIVADFEATPISGKPPLAVAFTDKSVSSTPISGWLWDFGDGTISGQQNPTHVYNSGTFTVSLQVTSGAGKATVTKKDFITVNPPVPTTPPRVTDGLQVLYQFNEGFGRIVHDLSGEGAPLDLEIKDLAGINWLGQGLSILTPTMIASTIPAEKIYNSCHLSNEITVEAWLKPANTVQDGPARIVSVSQNSHSRNITLGQGLWGSLPSDLYDIRLRTTERSANGMPSFSSPPGTLTREKSHVVFTRSRTGASRFFRNGVQIAETIISGDFSTWNPRFPLLLANETTNDYPWLGDLYLVAFYDRALGTREVEQNYKAGTSTQVATSSELPVLLPVFKRFYITSDNGSTIKTSEKAYETFGVQYPNLRCVTCISNGDQTLTVHEDIKATLRSYGARESDLHWLD